jgi:hypothetical protein
MDLHENTLQVNTRTFRLNHIELENAIVAFLFEDRMRLGTLAIAVPGSEEIAVGRSSVLVGSKYMMTTRALAERLAGRTRKMSIVSLFTELNEAEALRIYSKLLDKIAAWKESRSSRDSSIRQNI